MRSYVNERGYTLLEVLVTLALTVLLLTLATPAMTALIASARVQTGAQVLADSLILTRSEAVRRNGRVVMCKSASGRGCEHGTAWAQGWIVFHDSNNNATLDEGEEVIRRESVLVGSVRIAGNTPVRDYVSYTAWGRTRMSSGAFQAGTFVICPALIGDGQGKTVVINSAGRARIGSATAEQCT